MRMHVLSCKQLPGHFVNIYIAAFNDWNICSNSLENRCDELHIVALFVVGFSGNNIFSATFKAILPSTVVNMDLLFVHRKYHDIINYETAVVADSLIPLVFVASESYHVILYSDESFSHVHLNAFKSRDHHHNMRTLSWL